MSTPNLIPQPAVPPEAYVKGQPIGNSVTREGAPDFDREDQLPLPPSTDPISQGAVAFGSQVAENAKTYPQNLKEAYDKRNQPVKDQLKDAVNNNTQPTYYSRTPLGGAASPINTGESLADVFLPPQHTLAGEHPHVAAAALDEHTKNSFSVFDPRTGESLAGARKWAVPVAPEASQISITGAATSS